MAATISPRRMPAFRQPLEGAEVDPRGTSVRERNWNCENGGSTQQML